MPPSYSDLTVLQSILIRITVYTFHISKFCVVNWHGSISFTSHDIRSHDCWEMFPVSSRPWHELQQIRARIICHVLAPALVRGPRLSNWLLLRIICISWSVWVIHRVKRSNTDGGKPLLQPCHSSWADKTFTRSIIQLYPPKIQNQINACRKGNPWVEFEFYFCDQKSVSWHKEHWLSDVWCGRELCKQQGSRDGGRDSSVSQALDSQDFSTSKSGVWLGVSGGQWLVCCPRLSALRAPDIAFQHIPQPLCWLSESSRMCQVSGGVMASRFAGSGSLDIRYDSQFLMSWCACRVSERAGGRSGRTRFNLWKEMSQSGELSEDISYNRCTVQLYSCHCTAHCTLHCTLPSVCHSDQLENITAATNKYCDNPEIQP